MAVATAATIKTQLEAGVYPEDTLTVDNIFDYEQYVSRRKYPSCEIVTTQPESTLEDKGHTEFQTAYEIRYYVRNLGARSDEIANQKLVEDVIMAQIEAMVLQDHKVVFESKIWNRQQIQRDSNHPAYTVSILKVSIRQVTPTTANADGVLKFKLTGSTNLDSAPAGDYTYTNVFDVDLQSGYTDVEEVFESGNHIPAHFSGHLNGRFIANIMVNATDLGTTSEKLNKMPLLSANGEKPNYRFEYTNKTGDDPTPSTITKVFDVEVDSVNALYRTNTGVVFRIIAKLISDITVTIT